MYLYWRASVVARAFSTWRHYLPPWTAQLHNFTDNSHLKRKLTLTSSFLNIQFMAVLGNDGPAVFRCTVLSRGKLVFVFVFCSAAAELWPRPPHCWSFQITHRHTHTRTHPVALLWTSNQPLAQAATYTTHNKHMRRISMLSLGFELAIPAIERPQTCAL